MYLQLDHIALLVRDLDKSAAFYTAIPGIREVPNPMGGTHIRWFEYGPGQRFHMQAGTAKIRLERETHFAFAVDDFDGLVAHFRAHNIAFTDFAGKPGAMNRRSDRVLAVFVTDPNGYLLEFNNSLPGVIGAPPDAGQ